jgi:hypothetical protein
MSGAEGKLGLDMSDVAKALARMPQMTSVEAEKAVRELTRSFDKARVESKRLADQHQRDAMALKGFETNAKLGAESMSKMAAAASLISPELATGIDGAKRLVDLLGSAAGGGGQLAMALGPVAAAVAGVAAAYVVLQRDEQLANEEMKRSAETATLTEQQHRALERARIDLAVATNEITEVEARHQLAALEVEEQLSQLGAETRRQNEEQKAAAVSAQRWLDIIDNTIFKLNPYVKVLGLAADKLMGWTATVDAAATASEQLAQREAAVGTQIVATADARLEAAEARDKERAAAESASAAERAQEDAVRSARQAQAEAAREAAEAEAARVREMEARSTVVARLQDEEERLRIGMLDGSARVQAELAREIARVDELASAYAGVAEVQAEAEALRIALQEAAALRQAEIDEETAAVSAAAQQAAADAARAANAQKTADAKKAAAAQNDAVVGTVDASIEAFGRLAATQGKAWKEAAVIAFRLNQARALAQIPVDLAAANSSILAAWAHNPAMMGGLMALAAGTSVLQAGAIIGAAPPKLHVGGTISAHTAAAPDEIDVRARILPGEEFRVQPRQHGDQGQAPLVIVHSYQHRPLDVQIGDQLRMPRSQLAGAVRAARRKRGHRSR